MVGDWMVVGLVQLTVHVTENLRDRYTTLFNKTFYNKRDVFPSLS
jgi:hypothetical protein